MIEIMLDYEQMKKLAYTRQSEIGTSEVPK